MRDAVQSQPLTVCLIGRSLNMTIMTSTGVSDFTQSLIDSIQHVAPPLYSIPTTDRSMGRCRADSGSNGRQIWIGHTGRGSEPATH